MPSLPVIEEDKVRFSRSAPDGGAFDAPSLIRDDPYHDYLLRLGDDSLVLGQRLSEWCGHAPGLEVDLSLANLALDLIGQATHLLDQANDGNGDALAFHRDVLDYRNCWLVEQPNGDFARTIARQFLFSTYQHILYRELAQSPDAFLSGLAAKAVKEVAYHRELASDWTIRLGDGTEESKARMADGLDWCWRFIPELFEVDDLAAEAAARGIGVDPTVFRAEYDRRIGAVLAEATLAAPKDQRPIVGGRRGHHSEHLGHILAPMQYLPRTYPDATW